MIVRLLRLALSSLPAALSDVVLTDWEQKVVSHVEVVAQELSEAAVPKLLAKLDSASFREYLDQCCPSVSRLSSQELLERLTRHLEAAEVVSGFPAVIDPAQMYPDSAGMSVDYLNGSFFLNDWQAVLLHSRDPAAVWRNASMQFEDVSCDMEKQVVSVGIWPRGCNDQRVVQNFTMGACYSPVKTMVQSYKCDGAGNATRLVWLVNGNDTQREWTLNETVPCPHTDPIDAETVKADGQCHGSAIQNSTQGWVMQDQAEVSEYGLKPFQKQGAPSSLDEAAERPVYSLMNNNLIDQGSPIYGDVSAVFSSKYIHGGALLSAVDTGFVETCCLEKSSCFPWAPQHDCKAVSPFKQLGTMKHNKHLFLINEDFWGPASTLRSIFRRMEGDWGAQPLPGTNFLNYFEAAVLGQLKAPASVRFFIGAFPTLFGTDLGLRLQQWARKSGKVLVWALGPNNQPFATRPSASAPAFNFDLMTAARGFACNQRILDPLVLASTTASGSLPSDPESASTFQKLWDDVVKIRKAGSPSNATMAQHWHQLDGSLPSLRLRPMHGEDCQKELQQGECVGVTLQGQCVCYSKGASSEMLVV